MTQPVQLFPGYHPRRVQETVLYETVQEHWEAFQRLTREHGSLPKFVRREFDDYLKCGRPERGFARVQCTGCSFEHLLPFSCKRRGFCPSCLGRRMNDLSLHLVDQVLPEVPLRQWVLTVPFSLRYRLGFDRKASGQLIRCFHRALRRHMTHRAKQALGLGSVTDAKVGAITFVQRFDSAMRLNVHLHTLMLDGVFVDGQFHALQPPSPLQVAEVAAEVAARMTRFLEGDDHDDLQTDEPLLSGLYGAAVQGNDALGPRHGKRTVRLVEADGTVSAGPQLCAQVDGFTVHAETTVAARDRQRRLALCRYLARPPLAQKRLSKMSDGRLVYRMKRTWSDGTSAIVLHPYALLSRLCALVPPPRFHMLRYFGVLAGHAKDRKDVVPAGDPQQEPSGQLCLFTSDLENEPPKNKPSRTPWAKLLARIFKVDAETCPRCGSPCRIVAFVTDKDDIDRVLQALPRGPPFRPAGSSNHFQLALPLLA